MDRLKISLIHPTRERAEKARDTFVNWMGKATDKHDYEYIVSIDNDDMQKESYYENFSHTGVNVIENPNRSIVDAVNVAANLSTGDLLIVVSDDFDCPDQWNEKLMSHTLPESGEYAFLVNDGICDYQLMTIPMISRKLFNRLGYVYYQEYASMFADEDLLEVCKRLNCIVKSDLLFDHKHFITGKSEKDHTYTRQNQPAFWKLGQAVINRRRSENFGI